MKGYAWLAAAFAAGLLAAACGKDDEGGTIVPETPAVYLQPGQTLTVGYTLRNIRTNSVSVTSTPDGWSSPAVDQGAMTLTITAPAATDEDAAKTGSVVLNGVSPDGVVASASVFVGLVGTVDMSDRPANCFVVNEPEQHYVFDARCKGDGGPTMEPSSVRVIWQSVSSLVQYLDLKEGKASFFIGSKKDDTDAIKEGNALIGAYDAQGALLWSWHIWATSYNPDADGAAVDFNGYRMMRHNLGALDNAGGSAAEILASYGLYYQWGRKEPFIGPATWQASQGASASMYDDSGNRVTLNTAASDAVTGTMEYAVQHPLVFVTTAGKDDDWMVASEGVRWSDAARTIYDPCPSGWRVAPAAAFDGLQIIGTPSEDDSDKYGWTLGHGPTAAWFIGAGRRSYRDGTIQNYFDESMLPSRAMEMQPWAGYYWTGNTDQSLSTTFTFWFRQDDPAQSGVRNDRGMGRANGMQVRCVAVD